MPSELTYHVVPHSHWDREWYEPFQTFRLRLVELVDTVIDLMEADAGWTHFMLDGQTATAMDYLEVRPEARERLVRLVREGRLAVGPWHILMDEFLVSGETTIRNLEWGRRLSRELGACMQVGYLPDMFGHISQMPQILRLAGLEDAVVWRGVPSAVDRTAFTWEALDGSAVRTVYLATSYGNGAGLPVEAGDLADRIDQITSQLEPFQPGAELLVMCGTDHLLPTPGLPEALESASKTGAAFRISSLSGYIQAARGSSNGHLPRWRGELRSGARANLLMGVISNRVDLRRLVARAERELERYAEPLLALAAPGMAPGLLEVAWGKLIENSAHDTVCACSVDAVTEQGKVRWDEALQIASGVSAQGLRHLARSVGPLDGPGLVVWNPSPRARSGVVEIEVEVPEEWGALAAVDTETGARGATLELSRAEPVALAVEVPTAAVPAALEMVRGRRVGEEWVNGIEVRVLSEERIEADFLIDSTPKGFIDVEAEVARMREMALDHPNAIVAVRGLRPTRRRLLLEVPEVPPLGWTTLRLEEGTAQLGLDPAPPVDLALPRVVEGGDAGDTYNYCWPAHDRLVDDMQVVGDQMVEDDPFRRARRVDTRHGTLGDIRWTLRSQAGDPVVGVEMEWVNRREDHRVRIHLGLPQRAEGSLAGGPFSLDRRGLEAEGGRTEVGLPTFPARDVVMAGGLTLLLPHVTEYEIVADGNEIALTTLRCTGTISRGPMASRPLPAGPDISTPAAQCPGPQSFSYGVVGSGDWAEAAEAWLTPLRAELVDRRADGSLPSRQAGPALPAPLRLSSCRRLPTGELEVRAWNPTGEALPTAVPKGQKVDLLGRPLPGGRLRPFEIVTYRLP